MNSAKNCTSELCRISMIEFFNETMRYICEGFPRVVQIEIFFPFEQILEPVFNITKVQDVLDFEVFLDVLDIYSQWSWRKTM